MTRKQKLYKGAPAVIAALALVAMSASSANATTDENAHSGFQGGGTPVTIADVEMKVAGYDEQVAKEHGYRIEDHGDGTFSSIPVTDETAASLGGSPIEPFAVAIGSCGTSSVYADPYVGGVTITTGYDILPGYGALTGHTWNVDVVTSAGSVRVGFSGLANPLSQSWESDPRDVNLQSPESGSASVASGSTAVTQFGVVCTSGGPVDYW